LGTAEQPTPTELIRRTEDMGKTAGVTAAGSQMPDVPPSPAAPRHGRRPRLAASPRASRL